MTEKQRATQPDILNRVEEVIARGPYSDTWESLCEYRSPKWYEEAKFGIFIHWGVYAVPAFGNEWYPRNMYLEGTPEYAHHKKTYGDHKTFGYKDFIPLFKGEKFDAGEWLDLFEQAGAKYIMPVAEHHDGFQNVQKRIVPLERGRNGAQERRVGGDQAGDGSEGNDVLCLRPPGGALLVLQRRPEFRFGCSREP